MVTLVQLGANSRIDESVKIGADVVMGTDGVSMTNSHEFANVLARINTQWSSPRQSVTIWDEYWN